jgi:DNA mismatch endonuclease (patch repair protein)
MDRLTPAQRSYRMSLVRSRNTTPELVVRKIAHALGFRFRLHSKRLPGKPDLVFPRLRSIVQVNGCFWHRHPGCPKASVPGTRTDYWLAKFARNVERDAAVKRELERDGWRVLVLWECEIRNLALLTGRLREFLANEGISTVKAVDRAATAKRPESR